MRIVEVQPLGGHRLHLRFHDGAAGDIDLGRSVEFVGLLRALKDPDTFAEVQPNPEFGTIGWSNGVELDPYVLYSEITGAPLPGGQLLPTSLRPSRKPKGKKPTRPVVRTHKPAARRSRAG